MSDVTELLLSWRQGDAAALDRLIPVVYDELRRVARRRLRGESPGHALQSTALVHEVYLRLVDVDRMTVKNKAHFFALAATLMRQILVDHARRQHSDKRGGRATMVSLDGVSPVALPSSVDCSPSTRRSARCPQSTNVSVGSWSCDSLLGSASTRRPKRSECRQRRWSANGPWQRPGSTGNCHRTGESGVDANSEPFRTLWRTSLRLKHCEGW